MGLDKLDLLENARKFRQNLEKILATAEKLPPGDVRNRIIEETEKKIDSYERFSSKTTQTNEGYTRYCALIN
jgi:hypothetical protein